MKKLWLRSVVFKGRAAATEVIAGVLTGRQQAVQDVITEGADFVEKFGFKLGAYCIKVWRIRHRSKTPSMSTV